MTSKEAFEKLCKTPLYHEEYSEDENFYGEFVNTFYAEYDGTLDEVHTELCDTVKKDLEVLEILKRHSTSIGSDCYCRRIFVGIDYDELNEEEFRKIKEWLNGTR